MNIDQYLYTPEVDESQFLIATYEVQSKKMAAAVEAIAARQSMGNPNVRLENEADELLRTRLAKILDFKANLEGKKSATVRVAYPLANLESGAGRDHPVPRHNDGGPVPFLRRFARADAAACFCWIVGKPDRRSSDFCSPGLRDAGKVDRIEVKFPSRFPECQMTKTTLFPVKPMRRQGCASAS